MKEIKAIIRTFRLQAVLDELHAHPNLPGVTISYVQGFGRSVGRDEKPSADFVQYDTANLAKVECVVDDDMLDEIIDVIKKAAHTGQPGDGKITTYDVKEMVKIRTGQRSDTVI
jgi:nitrogen regulatory protein P-II 1